MDKAQAETKIQRLKVIIEDSLQRSSERCTQINDLLEPYLESSTGNPPTIYTIEAMIENRDQSQVSKMVEIYRDHMLKQMNGLVAGTEQYTNLVRIFEFIGKLTYLLAHLALDVRITQIDISEEFPRVLITQTGTTVSGRTVGTAYHYPKTVSLNKNDILNYAGEMQSSPMAGTRTVGPQLAWLVGHEIMHEFHRCFFPTLYDQTIEANRAKGSDPDIYQNDPGEQMCRLFGEEVVAYIERLGLQESIDLLQRFIESGEQGLPNIEPLSLR